MARRRVDRELVVRLFLNGVTCNQIATKVGATRQAISLILKGQGYDPAAVFAHRQEQERAERVERQERERAEELTRRRANAEPCRVCGEPVMRLGTKTCSPECAVSAVRWEEPPDANKGRGSRGSGVWIERLTPLMAHPKRWANLGEFSTTTAHLLNHSDRLRIPAGRWEFTMRRLPTHPRTKSDLYARYLGPEDES